MIAPLPPHSAAASPAKTLCVCADDFAASGPVTQAIVALLAERRIQATSVMTCSPRWPEDAKRLRSVADPTSVGLHLDWTSAFAVDAGHGMSLARLMGVCAIRALSHRHARDVIHRQLDAFESVWQHPPAHVDGHQHVHQFAVIREALFEALTQRYGQAWPWLRNSLVALPLQARWADRFKASIIQAWGASPFARRVQFMGQRVKGPLLGVYDFDPAEGVFAHRMTQWMQTFDGLDSAVLMVHPAVADDPKDPIASARVREWQYLSGSQWPELAARHGVSLG